MPAEPTLDPKAMSDEDLRAACAPRRWEERLERLGCLLPPFLSAVAVLGTAAWAQAILGRRWAAEVVFGGAFAFFGLCLSLFFLLGHVAGRRRAPYRAELQRRYGLAPRSTYLEEERAALQGEGAPAASLLVTAAALPHGGHRWIRVRVWTAPQPRARIEVRAVRWDGASHDIARAKLACSEADLPEAPRTELLALLEAPSPSALGALRSTVIDGLPCTVTVLERGAERVHQGSCNLAGLADDARDHPTVRFAQAVLSAGARVSGPQAGQCDATGHIGGDLT